VRRFASRSPDRALDIVVRLLGLPGRTFRARFAGQSPLLCHGDPERFGPIFGKAAPLKMASLRIVVANYQQAIHTVEFDQANRLAPRKTRRRNLHSMMRDAPVGYFLANYQLQFQSVRAACAELCAAIDYPNHDAHCQGSLESEALFVPRHCDDTDVLILQLFGTRRWRLEPNRDPPVGIDTPVRYPKKLRDGWSARFAANSPIVVMKPGSALYIPRGWWHEIRSDENSFALTLGIVPPRRAP
jgi:hypothetical protein